MSEETTISFSQAVIEYISRFEVVSFMILYDALDEAYPGLSASYKMTVLSELVQAGTIRRYDYYVASNRNEARQFFMPGDTRITL